jgi:hypothetical protein
VKVRDSVQGQGDRGARQSAGQQNAGRGSQRAVLMAQALAHENPAADTSIEMKTRLCPIQLPPSSGNPTIVEIPRADTPTPSQ